MTACPWCGEHHTVDRLCQSAKRGMTRRSFCFLFGAGIAAAALPRPSWLLGGGTVDLPMDVSTTIVHSLFSPTTVTFSPKHPHGLQIGQPITISFNGVDVLFRGAVEKIDTLGDGRQQVLAVDAVELASRASYFYGLHR